MALLAEAIELRRRGATAEIQAVVASGRGKRLMDQARGVQAEMAASETQLLQERQQEWLWQQRRSLALAVRAAIVAVPMAGCIGTGWLVSRLLPHPYGLLGHLAWLVGVFGCSFAAFAAIDRGARRLLPLAMLLRLSLVFPDQALFAKTHQYYVFTGTSDLDQWNNTFDPIITG